MEKKRDRVLLIDVGGTHTRVANCGRAEGDFAPRDIRIYPSRDWAGIEGIIRDYQGGRGIGPRAAVIGVAGPVSGGSARATNLPWTMDAADLEDALELSRVALLNDVEALAWAIPVLADGDVAVLNEGKHCVGSPAALIAPGTGLGEAFLVPCETGHQAYPSEGGHGDFGPGNRLEIQLLDFLMKETGHVSWERVCSGPGLCNIYRFLKEENRCQEPPALADALAASGDPARTIAEHALSRTPPAEIAVMAVQTFVSVLGAEAGNMALRYAARGGVYIGGGIAPKLFPFLNGGAFMDAFKAKGRLSAFVSEIPVKLILKPEANLWGLAHYARTAG